MYYLIGLRHVKGILLYGPPGMDTTCVTRVNVAGKDWLVALRRDDLWLAFNLLYLKKQQQEQKKSSRNNDNNIDVERTLLGKWGLENWTKENVFPRKFTFPFIKSEEINGTTQKLCQKDFILKVAAQDFVHRFTS